MQSKHDNNNNKFVYLGETFLLEDGLDLLSDEFVTQVAENSNFSSVLHCSQHFLQIYDNQANRIRKMIACLESIIADLSSHIVFGRDHIILQSLVLNSVFFKANLLIHQMKLL